MTVDLEAIRARHVAALDRLRILPDRGAQQAQFDIAELLAVIDDQGEHILDLERVLSERVRSERMAAKRHVSCMACGGAGVRHFCELPNDEQCSACDGRGYRNG